MIFAVMCNCMVKPCIANGNWDKGCDVYATTYALVKDTRSYTNCCSCGQITMMVTMRTMCNLDLLIFYKRRWGLEQQKNILMSATECEV